jgi:hypothetical protein
VPNVATSHVVGGCSTGIEKLQAGQTDGTEGHDGFASKEAKQEWIDWMTGANGGAGNGGGNSWWDALCSSENNGTGTTAKETKEEKALLEKLKGLFKNADGTLNKKTIAHLIGFPGSIGVVAAGYNAGLTYQQGGFNETVKRAFLTSILVTSVDGPLFFVLANKLKVNKGKYSLVDCTYPATGAQGLVGLVGTLGAQGILGLALGSATKNKSK